MVQPFQKKKSRCGRYMLCPRTGVGCTKKAKLCAWPSALHQARNHTSGRLPSHRCRSPGDFCLPHAQLVSWTPRRTVGGGKRGPAGGALGGGWPGDRGGAPLPRTPVSKGQHIDWCGSAESDCAHSGWAAAGNPAIIRGISRHLTQNTVWDVPLRLASHRGAFVRQQVLQHPRLDRANATQAGAGALRTQPPCWLGFHFWYPQHP